MHLGETLLPCKSKNKKCCLYETPYVAAPFWVLGDLIAKFCALHATSYKCTYKRQDFFWFTSDAFLKRHVLSFQDSYLKSLWGDLRAKVVLERTTYCVTWGVVRRVPSSISASRLCSDLSSWKKSLRNPEEQEGRKKGTLSNQPQPMRVTPTALLGSWVLQPIKGMMSLGTDFEKRAKWQGSVEEPAAKDFVARKVHTIKLTEVQWTSWNAIKCKECLRSPPEAVVRQATINLYSQVWKSLGDSFPELYCIDLVEAYVTRESVRSRIYVKRKGMTRDCPMDVCMRSLWQKAERGKNAGTNSCTRFHKHLASRKPVMCARYMRVHAQRGTWRTKGMRKWDEKLDSCAAKKGAKKLVSSNYAKIPDKESSEKIRETCEKTMFTPSNPIKTTNPIVTA